MYHLVTQKLAMTGNATPVLEVSRAVALEDFNAAGYESWVLSADNTLDLIEISLEGSNDLSNWSPIASSSLTTAAAPYHKVWKPAAKIPWEYVRVKFSVDSAANAHVMLRAAIQLSNLG